RRTTPLSGAKEALHRFSGAGRTFYPFRRKKIDVSAHVSAPCQRRREMKKRTKIILAVVAVLVLGFVAMGFIKRKDKDVARVTTAKVEKIDLVSKVTANGKIQARRKVDLSALVMGQIVNLAVKEGDKVNRGQLLLQIDRAQLAAQNAGRESAVAAMRSDLEAARADTEQARFRSEE